LRLDPGRQNKNYRLLSTELRKRIVDDFNIFKATPSSTNDHFLLYIIECVWVKVWWFFVKGIIFLKYKPHLLKTKNYMFFIEKKPLTPQPCQKLQRQESPEVKPLSISCPNI